MKILQIPQKLVYEKFYVHEIAPVSKIYFLKNTKKTCKSNNRDLNRDWIKIINHSFCSPVKKGKVPKKEKKNAFPHYLHWKNSFIASVFKDICFKQGTQLCFACSPIGLIYCGPSNWSFRRQIPCANHFMIIVYYEVHLHLFFRVNFSKKTYFFAFWRKKIRRHLVKVVLLSVVFCKV